MVFYNNTRNANVVGPMEGNVSYPGNMVDLPSNALATFSFTRFSVTYAGITRIAVTRRQKVIPP